MMNFKAPGAAVFLLCVSIIFPGVCKGERKRSSSGARTNSRTASTRKASLVDTLFLAPEIVVEGVRTTPDREIFNRSGFVGLIELKKEKSPISDAADILSRTVGIKVKRYGGLGSFATMSIRGSSSTQVQVYLDGVPLNDAYSGITNLADLALGDIGKIEIYRGFSPTGFGASSVGGTVNLVSNYRVRDGDGGESISFTALTSAGSFGTRKYSLASNASVYRFKLHGYAGYMESQGDFSFLDDNATPENPLDDETSARENNDFTRWNFTSRIDLDIPGFRTLSLNHNSLIREGGVPGIGANQSSRARLERKRRTTYLKIKPENALSGNLHTDGTIFHSWTAERFNDPGGDINLARQQTDNRITAIGSNIRTKYFIPAIPVSIEAFFEGKKERFHPVEYLPVYQSGPDRTRKTATLAASGDLVLLRDRLTITYGHRFEWYANEFYNEPFFPWLPPTPQGKITGSENTPGIGLRVQPFSFLTIKGNWGRYYRVPTFFEMFGNLGSVTGDNSLRPETGHNRDIGIILSADRFLGITRPFFEAIWLYNEIDNLILFFPNSQSTVKPENIGSARIRGIETSATGTIFNRLSLSGNYCWLESRDTSPIPYYNGNDLPSRPGHEASVTVEYNKARWSAAWEVAYTSSHFLDRANGKEVPARSSHNLSLVFRPPVEGMSFTIQGFNIGNKQANDVSGFPLPGRSIYASLRFEH